MAKQASNVKKNIAVWVSGGLALFFFIAASYFQFENYKNGDYSVMTDLWLATLWFFGVAIWYVEPKKPQRNKISGIDT